MVLIFFVGLPIDFTSFQNRCSGLPNSDTSSIIIIYSCIYIYICIPFTMEHLGPDDLRFTLRLYNYTRFFFLKPCKSHQVHFRVRVQIPQFFFCLGRGQLYPALQKTQLVRLHLCQQAGDQLWYQRCEGAHVEACVVSWQPPPSWGFSSSTNFPPREVTPTASRTESEDDD